MKTVKTGSKHRQTYIYYGADGTKHILRSGDIDPTTGEVITPEWIAMLHRLDDNEVYNNLRQTRQPVQKWEEDGLQAWREAHPDEDPPARLHMSLDYMDEEAYQSCEAQASLWAAESEHDDMRELLQEAVESLDAERRELYRRVIENGEDTDSVARDYGVSASAIRHRMSTVRRQIEDYIKKI